MNYIPVGKYKTIKKMADDGNEMADKFLKNFMNMSEEEMRKFLIHLELDKPKVCSLIDFLIDDENEAVTGYDNGMKLISNSDLSDKVKKEYLKQFEYIKNEEMEHLDILRKLRGK